MSQRRNNLLIRIYLVLFLLQADLEKNITAQCFPAKDGQCLAEQGQAFAVLLKIPESAKTLSGELWNKPASFKAIDQERKLWLAYLAPDRTQSPGTYLLRINLSLETGLDRKLEIPVLVQAKEYPVEKLTLPKEMAEFPPEIVERIKKDNKTLLAGMSALNPVCYWEGAFIKPVPGEVTGVFGAQRVINNVPKNPHTGADFRAELGQEVRAINHGKVSLVYQGYLTGNSLIIDHGCGLYSVYYHLSEVLVKEGALVKKGELIAKAGASGRASAPHLHLSLRLNNSYLDPISLFQISEMVEQEISREKAKSSP